MAGNTFRARMNGAPRLLVCVALAMVGVLGVSSAASARTHNGPQIIPRVATFVIPSTSPPTVSWTLNVWNRGDLIGSDTGTAGVLSVTVPRIIHGTVQADVRRNSHWYSGSRVALTGGGGNGGTGTGGGTGGGGTHGGGGKGGGGTGGPGPGTGTGGSTSPGGGGSPGAGTPGINGGSGSGGLSGVGGGTPAATGGSGSTGAAHPTPASGSGATPAAGTTGPVTLAAGSSKPPVVPGTELAFNDGGEQFWSTGLSGLGLLLLGAYLMVRRLPRRLTRRPLPEG
jgi:hypothetical protein